MFTRMMMVLLMCLVTGSATAQPVLRWSPADETIELGQEITLEIILDDTLAVRTIEFFIDYDGDILTSVHGTTGSLFDGLNLFSGFEDINPDGPGQVHGYCVVLDANQWAVGPGSLFSWTVRGDHAGLANLVTATVRLLPPGGGEYEGTVLPATTVEVNGTSPVDLYQESLLSLTLYPNPFNPRTNIAFSGQEKLEGRLEVFDLQGRRVAGLWQGTVGQDHTRTWDGRDEAGRLLPSGVYTFLLSTADGRQVTIRGTLLR